MDKETVGQPVILHLPKGKKERRKEIDNTALEEDVSKATISQAIPELFHPQLENQNKELLLQMKSVIHTIRNPETKENQKLLTISLVQFYIRNLGATLLV